MQVAHDGISSACLDDWKRSANKERSLMSIKLYKTCITIVDCSTTFYHWLTKYLKIILNRHKLPEKPSRSFVLYCQFENLD
jgi:hypothetical protein